ncbi:NAD-dependent succinate-semialdehyde dehydrogenase [uncultured Psychroserpens sp.]|uniref:NAD-dependent succinate-semialdehyde dehydrogenase n=1 Tax=uncultured Psychroserpens sp. TaxID=255436 RepID=UPI002622293C|nr:NAD-dependent succinate-semialdehyde dehydrogenase [uncultured Psychroserpens sp.]
MKSKIKTYNPYSNKVLNEYNIDSENDIERIIHDSHSAYKDWKLLEVNNRSKLLDHLSKRLHNNIEKYSQLITKEMGKPISESKAEIEKCIFLCDFYRKNADELLSDEIIETEANESFISYDPLGVILGIMPWNYPFWQVLRFAIPTLTAGNTVLLKHASNVTGCALALQEIFEASQYPKGCFQTLIVNHNATESIIADRRIKAVSLTGSEKAGKKIAEIAGKHLKKTVLELGGNNACIILEDANLEKHLDTIVKARMQNTGQSCIAAKRFIVVEAIYNKFLTEFTNKVKSITSGNPSDEKSQIGVMARKDLADTLEDQINRSIKNGAIIHFGNERHNTYYQPTILTNVKPGMAVFDEETFGPLAAIIKVKDKEAAYAMASNSKFGLGTMLFTDDVDDAIENIINIEDGAFFINELVKSDPRLPFGGTKNSGYGRELSREGILEFVNKKTVYINK